MFTLFSFSVRSGLAHTLRRIDIRRPSVRRVLRKAVALVTTFTTLASSTGCTGIREYLHNGCKVGPNYCRPAAPVAPNWIDANDKRVNTGCDDLCQWWKVFNDASLDALICTAYHQNLTLREAGFRVLQARAQLGIAKGEMFPQTQNLTGDYQRIARSRQTAGLAGGLPVGPRFFDQWDYGFNLDWELDFWGRFRRAVASQEDTLNASVEDFDGALVTLLGDVATTYTQMRTFEQRIEYAENNVKIQQDTLDIVEARFKASTISELDVDQARSTLNATQASLQELRIGLRQSINQLCILLGMPPEDLLARIGHGPIPTAPQEVVVGIPADLLRRRPDVRAAERRVAAQCEQIGIAETDWYPHVSIDGTLGGSAEKFSHLFEPGAFNANISPSFRWDLLNYFRILNNVAVQDARFQELIAIYQQAVLSANQDVENGLVVFLRGQERTKFQQQSVNDAVAAVNVALLQYKAGSTDFTTVTQVEQIQVLQQDTLAQAEGEIVAGLIQVYRALGGGWQIRLSNCVEQLPPPGAAEAIKQPNAEMIPPPESGAEPTTVPAPGTTTTPGATTPGTTPPATALPPQDLPPATNPAPLTPPPNPDTSTADPGYSEKPIPVAPGVNSTIK
jgi:NodT family efflux transporter outer membrane factor (OMF) lipoprotein